MSPEQLPEIPVYIVVTPGFMMLDLAGPAEAFRLARQFGGPFRMQLVGPEEKVASSLGLPVCDLKPLPDNVPDHALVVISGVENSAEMYQLPAAEEVVKWLVAQRNGEHYLATICSAAQLAARAGLLDGKRCTTHHTIIDRLKKMAPEAKVEDDRVFVEDGRFFSSAGVTAGIDLALYLIEKLAGAALAQQVAREMVVYLRRSGHDPQLSPWLEGRNHMHPAIHKVQDAISQFPDRHWSLNDLADIACMSVRNLSRLFKQHVGDSVLDYQQRLRVAYARQLIQATNVPIERVAEKSGFASARDFRRVWAKFEPLPPALVRQQMMEAV
ncbi:GlxA family transcriptional regulator [Leeia sp. TBRC 13508]|uniref:GlxA family transcriptional regulator n=1 Tax=Leeia speluncae TaxID=2884804 RepID=A0ABS8D584_9NEIS|nr:GlxA family transcriptional regulator [Leeia speluncae]MCB6183349.1 GlxA family transcriptional regulator [Leeia speluncae]